MPTIIDDRPGMTGYPKLQAASGPPSLWASTNRPFDRFLRQRAYVLSDPVRFCRLDARFRLGHDVLA